MDMNTLRVIIEVATFLTFIAIVAWAWSGRRVEDFRSAANLPFDADAGRNDA